MSYQVLARKHRPQTFEEVIGQTPITQTLVNAIRLNRLGHAFLFSGSRGIGKTTTARILAKALNCENGPTPEPCNVCRHCVEITAGSAMDVIEIDGASNRGIDEIRELRENVKYSPVSARCKVIIIDEVHMLTREAFNALLKTLEEPPEHVKFILATTEAHKVPVTILSRCQRYDFRRIDVATLTGFLMDVCRRESISVDEKTLEVIARMADGGLRDCLSLLDQVISFSGADIDHDQTMRLLGRIDPDLLSDVFRGIAAGNGAQALERFAQYIDSGGDETVFNRELMEITRDLMAFKMGATPRSTLPDDLPDLFSIDQLERMFRIMLDLEQSFRMTEFPRLLMDVSLVKMSRIEQLTPLSEILGQLKHLGRNPDMPLLTPPVRKQAPSRQPQPATQSRSSTPRTPGPRPPSTPAPPTRRTPSEPPRPDLTGTSATPKPEKSEFAGAPESAPVQTVSETPPPGDNAAPQTERDSASEDTQKKNVIARTDREQVDNAPLQALIDALPDKEAPLRSILAFSAVTSVDNDHLTLVFHPDYRMQYDMLENYENKALLFDAATQRTFGTPRGVYYHIGDDSAPLSVRDQKITQKRQQAQERWETAQNHPAVQKSLRLFRGSIRDVRVKSIKTAPVWSKQEADHVEEETDD